VPLEQKRVIKKIARVQKAKEDNSSKWNSRAKDILDGANPVQRRAIADRSKFKGVLCPRRSGKSFYITSDALYTGEQYAGSRILIISLTLKHAKENFWTNAPGGVFKQNELYNLKLKFNNTDFSWSHENGSRGRIAGAETRGDIEYFRGAAAEADIIFIDECKSFPQDLFKELIYDVLMPGLMTRGGILVLCGTPGSIPQGVFYEATCPDSFVEQDGSRRSTCITYEGKEVDVETGLWSRHHWGIQDNVAIPEQWKRALAIKKARGWDDVHPVWRREYLGEWVTDADELVYSYSRYRFDGRVNWKPDYTFSKTGLPPSLGPWNIVMGLDLGYEDDCAIVCAAWSETSKELRVFYSWKSPHITIDAFAERILEVIDTYGSPDAIIADKGALGTMIIESINSRHQLGIIAAEKTAKYDHIELINSDFASGRVKIIPDPEVDSLHTELCGLQWRLDDDKKLLIKQGKLREDPGCPNHLCDALLYLFRFCYHFYSERKDTPEEKRGTPEWYAAEERKVIQALQMQRTEKDVFVSRFDKMRQNDRRRLR
jgi:Terminase large subunit, T4likevirus-type, N-terminal